MKDILDEFMVKEVALPPSRVSNPNETITNGESPLMAQIRAGGSFHNPREPQVPIQTERPEHRAVLLLKMQGLTNIEIEERTGYTRVHIATIVKQPWAQAYMSQNMHLAGMDQVIHTLKGSALKAAKRLEEEIDNEDTGDARSRIAASKIVIQQIYGAAAVNVTHHVADDPDKASDAEIDARINELRQLQATRS